MKKKNSDSLTRSIKHYYNAECNTGKIARLHSFIDQYRQVCQFFIDYMYSNSFEHFDVQKDILDFPPTYVDYQLADSFIEEHNLIIASRAASSAMTQALGIVSGSVAIRRKLLYIIKKRKEENKPTEYYEKKLEKAILRKPILGDWFNPEISSKIIDFEYDSKYFDSFIRFKSKGFEPICVPLKNSKADQKWLKNKAIRLNSVILSKKYISIRYRLKRPELKSSGTIVGADTGLKSVVTLSDGQASKPDRHGHTLDSICKKLARKKKGGRAFERAAAHRENYINWSINQLNFSDIKQINLEEVVNITYKKRTSRLLSGWINAFIESKILRLAEEQGVLVNLQPSQYRSQRCCECGMVRKANRKGKLYKCKNCGLEIDSDLNSAKNHEQELPKIPYGFCETKLNISGFFWKETGLFDLDGKELETLAPEKDIKNLFA